MIWVAQNSCPTHDPLSSSHINASEKAMAPHSRTLAWKTHGRRRLVGCNPWGRKESDTTERLHFHFSLSCIGEGNGNPLQCCLENPRDGGAWWAAVYGAAQSQTRLKRLSNSSTLMHTVHALLMLKISFVNFHWQIIKLWNNLKGIFQNYMCTYPNFRSKISFHRKLGNKE